LKRAAVVAVLLIAAFALVGAIVERNWVQILRLNETAGLKVVHDGRRLTVSGEMIHSMLTVKLVRWERLGGALYFEVFIGAIHGSEGRGSYGTTLEIPDDVNEIRFGGPPGRRGVCLLAGHPIWLPTSSAGEESNTIWKRP
jgi:hypothetical protein